MSAYRTARCILYRDGEYLLAVHGSFWRSRAPRWGLPGGRIERGESPEAAAIREIREELFITLGELLEIGPFPYKNALHMVYAATWHGSVEHWDELELLDVAWFRESEIADLAENDALHASYELAAIRSLEAKLVS